MPTAALTTPSDRTSRTGTPLRKPTGGPLALTKRHLALIEFMVHGIPRAFPRHPDIEPHVALGINEAADCAGIRRKCARDLMGWPIFTTALNAENAKLRTGEHPRSIHTLIEVRDDPGAGKAADRKVRMGAALALLGEQAKGTTVNVQVNNTTNVTPGIVVRRYEPKTIENED